jgi:hypothetical protein
MQKLQENYPSPLWKYLISYSEYPELFPPKWGVIEREPGKVLLFDSEEEAEIFVNENPEFFCHFNRVSLDDFVAHQKSKPFRAREPEWTVVPAKEP